MKTVASEQADVEVARLAFEVVLNLFDLADVDVVLRLVIDSLVSSTYWSPQKVSKDSTVAEKFEEAFVR